MKTEVSLECPSSEAAWRSVEVLINELIDWDAQCSAPLGMSRAEVVQAFYPDSIDDVRQQTVAPDGLMLLAASVEGAAGCAGYKRLDAETCELYNVYLRPPFRGKGVATRMLAELQRQARVCGYHAMRLETATFMVEAHALYGRFGFRVRDHYRPHEGDKAAVTLSMQCDLRSMNP